MANNATENRDKQKECIVIYYRKAMLKLPAIKKTPDQYQTQSLVAMICQYFALYPLPPTSIALTTISESKAKEYDELLADKKKSITLAKDGICFSFAQPIPAGYYILTLFEHAIKIAVFRKLEATDTQEAKKETIEKALKDAPVCSIHSTLTLKKMFNACYLVIESTVVSSVNSKQMAQIEVDFEVVSGDIKKMCVVEYSPLTEERTRMISQSRGWGVSVGAGVSGAPSIDFGFNYSRQSTFSEEVKDWRTSVSPIPPPETEFNAQLGAKWIVSLNPKESVTKRYPLSAQNSLSKQFTVVCQLLPETIEGELFEIVFEVRQRLVLWSSITSPGDKEHLRLSLEKERANSINFTSKPIHARFKVHRNHIKLDGKFESTQLPNVQLIQDIPEPNYIQYDDEEQGSDGK